MIIICLGFSSVKEKRNGTRMLFENLRALRAILLDTYCLHVEATIDRS